MKNWKLCKFWKNKKPENTLLDNIQEHINFIENHGYKINVVDYKEHYSYNILKNCVLSLTEMKGVLKDITIYKTMKTDEIYSHLKWIVAVINQYEKQTILNTDINKLKIK